MTQLSKASGLVGSDVGVFYGVIQSLSQLQFRTGRQLEALATMQSGIEDIKRPSLRQRMLKKLLKAPIKLLDRS